LHHPESLSVEDEGLLSGRFILLQASPNIVTDHQIGTNLTVFSAQSEHQLLSLAACAMVC
jgi:hypothetical protein